MTNSDCTVYRHNALTQGFDRLYIPRAVWMECRAANVLKSGMQSADSAVIHIAEKYADGAPRTVGKDMLVRGNCPFEFDNSNAQSISDSMREFRTLYRFVTATSIDNYLYGGLPHVEVSAR